MTALDSAAQLATAAGVFALAGQMYFARTAQRADFEARFSERYVAIVDRITPQELLGEVQHMIAESARFYYDYFNLCEEEIYYRQRRRVCRATWLDWWTGMQINLLRPPFEDAWKKVGEGKQEFKGLTKAIEHIRSGATAEDVSKYDPRRRPR